jgi:uncharacterized protein
LEDTLILYHAKCVDGFGSAWAAWRYLGDKGAQYIPCQYGETPPDVTGKRVYILDFSFKRDVLIDMASRAKEVILLDHHKTAEEDLRDLSAPNMSITFDMARSGAKITWDHFFPNTPCWLVDYIQDRDLWKFALPSSSQINCYIQATELTFSAYTEMFEQGLESACKMGEGAHRWMRFYVEAAKKNHVRDRFLGYGNVPIVNATYTSISEVVGELSENNLFAVGWYKRDDGMISYSLRSRGDFDVANLAKTMGGGGHKNAAGFTAAKLPWELTASREVVSTIPAR